MKIDKQSYFSLTGALFCTTVFSITYTKVFTGMIFEPGDLQILFKKYIL